MRLTALCVCGTLLTFSSLSWIAADSDEGLLLGDEGFGACAATLRPDGPCTQGQHESTCPYLFSLPPLTVHLPQQLGELEEIMKDLQKLKDSVDQLRELCADCTVSQTERECGRQREREHEKLNESEDRREDGDGRNWMNERLQENGRDFRHECGKHSDKVEKMEGDGNSEKRLILEEKEGKKWEAERESDKGVTKENEREETLTEVAGKDGKTQTEGTKGKDKQGQTKLSVAGGNDRIVDMLKENVADKNNRQTETKRNKENAEKQNTKGYQEDKLENGKERKTTSTVKNREKAEESGHHVRRDKTKETEKKTQTEASDRIKMSDDHDKHTNKKQEQHGEERKKEMEKGIKVERNNEKPKQTESIGRTEKQKTIKEGEVEEEGRETGKEIKTEGEKTKSVQRLSDGELSSSKSIERTDFVPISPTPHSVISITSRPGSTHSKKATIFTSSLPSPPLPSSTLDLITDVIHETITAYGPTQSTGLGAAGISEPLRLDADSATTTATVSTLGGPGQQITSATTEFNSAARVRPKEDFREHITLTTPTTTTTTPHQNLFITAFPGATDQSRWTAKKNVSSNTKTGVKPLPGRGTKPGEKHKPGIKPEADQKQKNPRNDRKPDRAPFPDKKTKHDQKQKPSHFKPSTNQSKPATVPKRVQISKPDQRTPPDILPTDQNLKDNPLPKHDHNRTPDQNKLPIQKPKSDEKSVTPVQTPTSHQRPQTENTTHSSKHPRIDREHESGETPIINPNSKPEEKTVHLPKTDKPDQKQKPEKKQKSEEKTKPDQRFELNEYPQPVHEPEVKKSETASFTPKPNQKPLTESMENPDGNPSLETKSDQDSTPGEKMTPDQAKTPPDQKPKSSQKISQINQKPKLVHEPEAKNSETPRFTPKPNQKPVTESEEKSHENPSLETKSDQDSTPVQKITPDRVKTPADQKPKPNQKISKINQKPKPGQVPKSNQKHPTLVTGVKTKPNVNPKTDQAPQTNLQTTEPGVMPNLNPKSVPDEVPKTESNKTSKPRPPPRYRPPTRPTVKPGATPVQRPKPAVQPKPSPKTKTHLDPPQISWTTSDNIQNSQTDMPPTSGPVKQITEVTHSPGDAEFTPSMREAITLGPKTSNSLKTGPFPHLRTPSEDFTMSPNSKITSDLRPQTARQPPSIPMTTRPNKILHGILPSVIPSTSPDSTKPNLTPKSDPSLQAEILQNVEETAPAIPVPSPSSQITSTLSPDFRSTTPTTSGPEPLAAESSTPSARELRVKINQVAAFLNNSLSPNGRPPNRHPEDTQGGSRPDRTDSKLPTRTPSKATMARRDCSDLLLRGERKSGVYLVTPDLRSRSFPVFCDMEQHGGGWTLLQRRQDGSVSFNRTWAEYQSGFGELDGGEFWLGNNMIHLLTRDRDMVLRVDLEDFNGVTGYAQYEQFRVASERLRYRLTVGGYSGTAGDALRFSKTYDHNNRAFTTPDRDHDRYPSGNCGAYYSSGWWFDACMAANLNGRYYEGRYRGVRDGIFWGTWHNISTEYYPTNERRSFKTVRMMIRPKGFAP